jgi:soluble lytic murein transglycosylase
MQVMDGTNLDPGYGVKPAADNSPAERARVGQDYLAALVKKYAGDPAKAWAAYNAGPGNVDKAVADATSVGEPGLWLQALGEYQSEANHAQTVAYVTNNVNQLQKGGGVPPMPTLQDIHDSIRTQLGPNASPALVSKALAEGSRQFSDALNARKEQAEQTVTAAQTYLAQNHGDFNSLPPDLHAAVVALAPDKLPGLQTFANSIANPPIKDNMVAYHTAFEHPEELAAMPDSMFQNFVTTNFSEATQKQLGTLRQNAINGKIDIGPGSINEPVFTRELNNRLQSIGLLDNKGKPLDVGQVGTISNFLRNAALDQQRQTGQKMTEDQLVKYVDGQFLKSTELPGMLWGSNTKPTLSMTSGDIPGDQLDQIKAALAKQGNKSPSDDQIMRTYWARSGK